MPTTYRYRFQGHRLKASYLTPSSSSTASSLVTCDINFTTEPERLGSGQYGYVYAADVSCNSVTYDGPELVIKCIAWEKHESKEPHLKEANFFAEVNGGPAEVIFLEGNGNFCYLICKRIPGRQLKHWLEADDVPHPEKLRILYHVYEALEKKLHAKGIIHGDLSLGNILVDFNAEADMYEVNFIDFGWSYRLSDELAKNPRRLTSRPVRYQHPGTDDAHTVVKPSPYHDIVMLSKSIHFTEFASKTHLRAYFFVFWNPKRVFTTEYLCSWFQARLQKALVEQAKTIRENYSLARWLQFTQLAEANDIEQVHTFFRRFQVAELKDLNFNTLTFADWPRKFHGVQERLLTRYYRKDDRLVEACTFSNDELRARLPSHFSGVTDDQLNDIRNEAFFYVKKQITEVLSSLTGENIYLLDASTLRARLPIHLQSISAAIIDETLEKFVVARRQKEFKSLTDLLGNSDNQLSILFLLCMGRERFQSCLAAIPEYHNLAFSLTAKELDELWQPLSASVTDHTADKETLITQLSQLFSEIGNETLLDVTGIDILSINCNGANPIALAQHKINQAITQLQRKLTLDSLHRLCDTLEEHRARTALAYWQTAFEHLDQQRPEASAHDWQALNQQLGLSTLIVNGFLACDERSRTARQAYQDYALSKPEDHSLQSLCHIVAAQTKRGNLHSTSFFICVLDQSHEASTDLDHNPLKDFLEQEELTECFQNRHYQEEFDRPQPRLFCTSATPMHRSQVLRAVRSYAKREHLGELSSGIEEPPSAGCKTNWQMRA